MIKRLFTNIPLAFFPSFAWVTIILAFVEYKGIHKNRLKHRTEPSWTPSPAVLSVLVSTFEFLLTLLIFSNPSIWNPHFITQIGQSGLIHEHSDFLPFVTTFWEQGTQNLIYIIGLLFVIQLIKMVIKFKKACSLRSK